MAENNIAFFNKLTADETRTAFSCKMNSINIAKSSRSAPYSIPKQTSSSDIVKKEYLLLKGTSSPKTSTSRKALRRL